MARFHRELAGLATDWVQAKRRGLAHGSPQTVTDSGGTVKEYSWHGQELDRNELRKVKQIREKGGVVAFLFEAKATMRFGTGAELQSENDDVQAFLDDAFPNIDLLTLDLGADATWYPYALGETVETRGGGFSHIEPIEPWTMLPKTDRHGEIVVWEQKTRGDPGRDPVPFDPDEIGSITLNKAAARDKIGVSEVLRSEEEITNYKQNQEAVNKAIEIAGFPHHIWTVGAEGRSPVDDSDLRMVRNLIDNMDGDTQFVVGPDVDHDKITAADFDFEGVTRRDLRILTTAVGLPLEIAGYGREGLGSGSEADLIMSLLALQNEVARRRFEVQFVDEFVRPVIEQYSAFSPDEPVEMHVPSFLDDTSELADLIQKVGGYMSTAEVRDRLDLPPLEDDDMAESYRSPQQVEEQEEGDVQDDGPFGGGFFEDGKSLADPMINGHDLDPETGTGVCESTGKEIEAELMSELAEDCPHCGEALSVFSDDYDLSDGDDGDRSLVTDATPDWDRHFLSMLTDSAWADSTDRALISDSGVPEIVQTRLREAILGGALFSDFDTIPSDKLAAFRQDFADMLESGGWTTDELTAQIQEFEPSLSDSEAERIARTEAASAVNTARKSAYEERGLADEAAFKWTGTEDHRTTEACTWLKEQTNPDFGGDPVTLSELQDLVKEAPSHDDDMQNDLARPSNYVVHPQERHTYVRHVE